ncbi:MAG: hypothetical protein JSS49_16200 [Planctomycetes bacterium]|nr:hypothetical protein [Planctomycetota bacterium]
MFMVPHSKYILAVGIAVGLIGCGGSSPPKKTESVESKPPADSKPTTKPEAVIPVAKPAGIPRIEADSAAAAVMKTLTALQVGNMAEAYDFLPPAYQSDVDGLVHEFAERMDPEIWSRLIGTARKSVEVLKTKKDLILALDLFRDRPEAEPYRKSWDSSVQLLETFANSDLGELPRLKQLSVKSLLPGKSGSSLPQDAICLALGANLSRQFVGVTVTPIRSEGAEQVVAIRGPRDDKPTEFTYVQHDGRWLPKSLVEQWADGIKADRDWLEKLPDRIKVIKPQLMDALTRTDEILDQLLAASNREQFEQAAGPAILSLATAWPNLQLLSRQFLVGQNEWPRVTITINRELTESELSKLVTAVLKPLREAGSDYTLLANDGRTVCRMMHVGDVESLQKSLATHFNIPADDVAIDRESSTIKVELAN